MSFDSLFYPFFLLIVVVLHHVLPHRYRRFLLLIASAVFYASWNIPLTLLLYGVIAVTYCAGLLIGKWSSYQKRRKAVVSAALVVCVCLLLYFKYFRFLMDGISSLVRLLGGRGEWQLWNVLLPVGVSFYTFQAMSYVIDVYRGRAPERDFGYYALYISFFPQLVAGPIERADALLPQLKAERTVTENDRKEAYRFLLSGYFRKIVLADFCGIFVDRVYSASMPDGSAVMIGTLLFAVQIYCDFAGYSEIARGSARLLGIHLMQNFARPYLAPDIRTFWRRWHISLSGWLTDYVYIPLGGSRKGLLRQIAATVAVFLISGLWHGANWTFVLWGLLHGLLVVLCVLISRADIKVIKSRFLTICSTALTFFCVTLLWIFFRASSVSQAWNLFSVLFSRWNVLEGIGILQMTWQDSVRLLLSVAGMIYLPYLTAKNENPRYMTQVFLVLAILVAWWIRLDTGTASTFIYFQF